MKIKYSQSLKKVARVLRHNQTDAEKFLWRRIRGKQIKGYQFFRQRPIGKYVVDFYCPKAKLMIEIDGGQHYEEKNIIKNKARERYFESLGLKIIKFTNLYVLKNIDNVADRIYFILK